MNIDLQLDDSKEMFYSTPSIKGLMQQLHHLAFFGDGLSIVQGPIGSGKTKLISALSETFIEAHEFCVIGLESESDLTQFVQELAQSLGLLKQENLSVGELLSQLRHFAQSLASDQKLCVVCIDDAHYLDEQSIGAVLSLLQGSSEGNYGLHIILFSQPGLVEQIDALQILDVPAYDFSMPALSPTELQELILKCTPLDDIDKTKLQQIWGHAKGYPGPALKMIMASSVKKEKSGFGGSESKHDQKQTGDEQRKFFILPVGHLAAISVLLGVLIWSVIYTQSKDENEEKYSVTKSIPIAKTENSKNENSKNESNVTDNTQSKSIGDDGGRLESEDLSADVSDREIIDLHENIPQPKREKIKDLSDEFKVVQQTKIVNETQKLKQIEEALPPRKEEIKATIPEIYPSTSELGVRETNQGKTDGASDMPKENRSKPEPKAPRENVTQAKEKVAQFSPDESFLLSQAPDAYTLQVLAASKSSSLEQYIARQPNKDRLFMYRGRREGKSWYVVVANVYTTRAAALSARSGLPAEQAKAGPWPRKLSAIQEEIREYMSQ